MFNYDPVHRAIWREIEASGRFYSGDGEYIDLRDASSREFNEGIARRERTFRKDVRQVLWGFRTEVDFERAICRMLNGWGYECARQVQCPVGIIDILTSFAVFELKYDMEQGDLFQAVGQVLLYSRAVGGNRFPIIAFTARKHIDWGGALEHAADLGIMLWQWPNTVYDRDTQKWKK